MPEEKTGVVPFNKTPTCFEAETIIKKLASSGAIIWSNHCKKRMEERSITMPQILNCLLKGKVTEEPFLNHANGSGYETAVEKITAGEKLKVVVCIKLSEKLLIVTVY
jgi:hypothetical protein